MARERRGPARWWRQRSLRARLTIITSAGLALALALAAVLLVNALRLSLIRGLDDSARQEAVEVAALIDQGRLPDPVPVAPGTITIQVLDAQGQISDVSPGADRLVPMMSPGQAEAAARTGQGRMLDGPPLGMPSLLRVVAVGASHHQTVIAAASFAQVRDSLVARYAAARVPVRADAPGPAAAAPCVVAGDPDALARLLVNLLDNAVRHAASQVSVAVRAGAGWAELTVCDDGPGIAAEDAERAFGRFSRLDDARSRTGQGGAQGSGLGLAIVRSTAEAHGGSVALGDARPGLRAVVRLPLDGRSS